MAILNVMASSKDGCPDLYAFRSAPDGRSGYCGAYGAGGCLCNIEIILEKPVDSPQCLFIKRRRDIRTEYFFQKTFAQRNRELIDQPSDAQLIIRKYGLLRIE